VGNERKQNNYSNGKKTKAKTNINEGGKPLVTEILKDIDIHEGLEGIF
jgi:hypothetical protein